MQSLEQLFQQSAAAFLVVDVQNDYCDQKGALSRAGFDVSGVARMMPQLHQLLAAAHACEMPVIFVQTVHDGLTDSALWHDRAGGKMRDVCRPGTWGGQFYEIKPGQDDMVIQKCRYSAFMHTKLDLMLRARDIKTLIVAGVATNVCVESTVRDACMLDYQVVLAADACASFSADAHNMSVENIDRYFGRSADAAQIIGALLAPVRLAAF